MEKSNIMIFTKSLQIQTHAQLLLFRVWRVELVSKYKYLGFLIDDSLSFGPHIQDIVRKLKSKLGLFLESSIVFL